MCRAPLAPARGAFDAPRGASMAAWEAQLAAAFQAPFYFVPAAFNSLIAMAKPFAASSVF